MPDNKRQHFLPRHYMRLFADAEDMIGAASITPYKFVGPTALGKQCQSDYYYVNEEENPEDETDKWISHVERESAPLLRDIGRKFSMTGDEHVGMMMLAVIFLNRTRKAAEIGKLSAKWWADVIIKDAIDRGELREPQGGWKPGMMDFKGTNSMLLRHCLFHPFFEMVTLNYKFLKPAEETGSSFVTSDNPVVVMNQLLDKRGSERSFAGFSRSGFQLVFPLGPECCLFFYDPKVYKVGGKNSSVVVLKPADVELVNSLQVQSADKVLLFAPTTTKSGVGELISKFSRFRQSIDSHFQQWGEETGKETFVLHRGSQATLPSPWNFSRHSGNRK